LRRYAVRRPETVEEAFRLAGLTAREQHVVPERLAGRSYGDIAADDAVRKPDGNRFSRQRLQQLEQDALAKLGAPASVRECVHSDDRLERAVAMRERGRLVHLEELRHDPQKADRQRWERRPAWERRHEARVARFLARV
jgi:hypothetical protein